MQIIYLFGFASGPLSDKTQFFKEKFSSKRIEFQIYDYQPTPNAFSNMRVSHLVKNLHNYISINFPEEKVSLFGSSFGGLLVTLYTHLYPERVDRLFLIAPALQFTAEFISQTLNAPFSQWEEDGETPVEHYRFNGNIPLKFSFLKDLKENPVPKFSLTNFPVKTMIFHGEEDEVVPSIWSVNFGQLNSKVKTHILNGDHQLSDQKLKIWNIIETELKLK